MRNGEAISTMRGKDVEREDRVTVAANLSPLDTALRLTAAGLSVLPIKPDGTKSPAIASWSEFQNRIATADEIRTMFRPGLGIAIVAGRASGNLEILDIEAAAPFAEFCELIREHAPQLLEKLPHVETPSGGHHLFYRCDEISGNQKLAMRVSDSHPPEVIFETRGRGGYVVTISSPAACHEDQREYRLVHGGLTQIPRISPAERGFLLDAARSFNQVVRKAHVDRKPSTNNNGNRNGARPGDVFNARTNWPEVLEPHGWVAIGGRGEETLWRRPGKTFSFSATTNYRGSDLFYCFSTNAQPFEHETSYSKFAVYALLNHASDYKAAARTIAEEYGMKDERPRDRVEATAPVDEERQAIRDEEGSAALALFEKAEPLGKPTLYISGGSIADNVHDAEECLADSSLADPERGIYQRSGMLVHVARLDKPCTTGGIRRPTGTLQILTASSDLIRVRLAEAARWMKYRRRENDYVPTDPPTDVARTLTATAGEWPHTPYLSGIVQAPALRLDGTILQDPRFDPDSGLFFDPARTVFPHIADSPTRADAEKALHKLRLVIDTFPYVDDASRAVMVAAMMTPVCRHAMRSAPLFGFSAPAPGSGKTLLSYLPSYLATGLAPRLFSFPETPEESKKRYLAILAEGSPIAVIDNVERPLRDDALCTILTEPAWSERQLGTNQTLTVSTATTWLATGNGFRVAGDLSSRTLLCSIDAGMERPEERKFDVNLHEYVPKHRGELVAASLTIVRAYIAARRPESNIPPFGRFEDWSRIVREPLIWLGMADPCETRKTVQARDTVRENLTALLVSWHAVFGESGRTVEEALTEIEKLNDGVTVPAGEEGENLTALAAAIRCVAEDGKTISGRKLGNYVVRHERRIEAKLRFERSGEKRNRQIWRAAMLVMTVSTPNLPLRTKNGLHPNHIYDGESHVETVQTNNGPETPSPDSPAIDSVLRALAALNRWSVTRVIAEQAGLPEAEARMHLEALYLAGTVERDGSDALTIWQVRKGDSL